MMNDTMLGDPIHGELHSTDAHAGVQVVIYKAGSLVAYTPLAWEQIEIESLEIVTAAGGDTFLAIDLPANIGTTPTAGTTVVRGTLAANSGLVQSFMHYTGIVGGVPYVVSPAGALDVNFRGMLRQTNPTGRPNWREHMTGNGAGNQGPTL